MPHADPQANTQRKLAIPRSQVLKHSLLALAVLSLCKATAWAVPTQTPLINRPGNKPKPNVMLTLDDSGSMTYQYAPEREFYKNGVAITFPNDGRLYVHPSEIKKNIFDINRRWPIDGVRADDTHFMTAVTDLGKYDDAFRLRQAQMRSSDVNSIFYNPRILYKPWTKLDSAGNLVSFRPAVYASAALDPLAMDDQGSTTQADTSTVDLGNTTQSFNRRWYCGGNIRDTHCAETKLPFNPGLFYLLKSPGADPTVFNNFADYDLNNGRSEVKFDRAYPARTDCTIKQNTSTAATDGSFEGSTTCGISQEKQNFANWFVYFRSRLMIAQGAMPETFNRFSDTLRVGWGTIHRATDMNRSQNFDVDGATSSTVQQGVRDLNTAHKNNFSAWLRNLDIWPFTPTKGAIAAVGDYFKRTDAGSPWRNDASATINPTDTTSVIGDALACRRSYHIVMTDGYYLLGSSDPREDLLKNRNTDNTTVSPGSTSANNYTPEAPFSDGASGTLADYTMALWANDLQSGIADQVPPMVVAANSDSLIDQKLASVKSNPATWQHLTHFFLGFGVVGTFPTNDQTLKALINRNARSAGALVDYWEDSPNQIDDLWHAAINSRGAYFNVNNSEELQKALTTALNLSETSRLKEAGLATAASTLSANNMKFVPEYRAVSWTGDIKAYTLNASGVASSTPSWSASAQLPTWRNRNIFFWQTSPTTTNADAGAAVAFNSTNVGNQLSATLVDYIRGQASSGLRERQDVDIDGSRATTRANVLPDFVNSTPLYIQGAQDLGYSTLPGAPNASASDNYSTYLAAKQGRSQGVLLIGGNSGMLHAFNAGTGTEVFAFMPRTSLPNLARITRSDYGSASNFHQYFVDGPLVESDVYTSLGSDRASWHNIVVGTMGAGGRSVFALKLPKTDPTDLDANAVLWERTSDQYADLGYITAAPQIGVMPNGEWKVFVGNGVDSRNGKAALLMMDVATGDTTAITVSDDLDNGLGGVTLMKNQMGQVIGAYAGDALGRLWRFEYDPALGTLVAGYNGNALFRAHDGAGTSAQTQAIVAAPVTVSHPMGGQLVVFNTGRLLYDTDATSSRTQTVYGIWDHEPIDQLTATKSTVFSLTASDRSLLQSQAISGLAEASTSTAAFYDLTRNTVTWGAVTSGQGWYLDLVVPESGGSWARPKAIYAPQKLGASVLVTAVKPGSTEASCTGTQATGYGFFIKALTGARSLRESVDVNGNGTIDSSDGLAAGFSYTGGGSQRLLTDPVTSTTEPNCKGGNAQRAEGGIGLKDCPDVSQRIKDRVWRQLLNPPVPQP